MDHKTVLSHLRKVGFKKKINVWMPHQLTVKDMMDEKLGQREDCENRLLKFFAHKGQVFYERGITCKMTTENTAKRSIIDPNRNIRTARGLLATDHVILNHGQVTWTTPELAPPSPNYHTTPTGGRFSSRQI
ncbi:hypothetical protein TNCV_1287471 [Trichonephila clavipes]|nr:hypothetical protein TNCV_1287471 [Trichonephila clavipes]